VRIEDKDDRWTRKHNNDITYLYNLRAGRSDLSYGTQCATMNGVPGEVVERAVELARLASAGEDLVALCSALKDDEVEELSHAENVARMFLAEDFDRAWTKEELKTALADMLEIDAATEPTSPA
jgi:DNA mismatch repair ATPase MutS